MKILIGGDSWGCGEWGYANGDHTDPTQYGILHTGLEQYFKNDGHEVTNTSKGRSSNKDSIARLKSALGTEPDIIIWFQSDPLRDNRPYDDFTDICDTWNNLINYNNKLLLQHYKSLNDIGKKIYCIGGCSKIKTDFIVNFSNLVPIIESIPEFLYTQHKHPEIWSSDWFIKVDKLSIDILKNLAKQKKWQDKLHFGEYQEYFQPDGCHTNRKGHLKIYEHIKSVVRLT
jgi:hypothetical protein